MKLLFAYILRTFVSLCLAGIIGGVSVAQVRPVNDQGALGLGQLLRRLNTTARVMMIGAHPDDEDSALLAYLARGENARTAYLSLTRGDGGQNILGPELFESLGVIRTEELLQARRLDGAEQYFTRAFDYGFSKTLAEAKEKWDEKVVLCDAVRAIRLFRPLVVISRFSGTPADGHGQHQYSGYISPLAVKAAADGSQCTSAGDPWQVLKFYVGQGFRSNTEPGLRINTGKYDPLLGRSYFEIAMEGRSQHKSQEQGLQELRGPQYSGLNLVDSKVAKVEKETSIFDGIDITLKRIMPKSAERFQQALKEYNPNTPEKLLPLLLEAYQSAHQDGKNTFWENEFKADDEVKSSAADYILKVAATLQKYREIKEAIRLAAGIQFEKLSDRETVVAGGTFDVNVKIFFPENSGIRLKNVKIRTPDGWPPPTELSDVKPAQQQGFFRRETGNAERSFTVAVPKSEKLSQPYWLEDPREGALYQPQAKSDQTLPFQPPLVSAVITMEIAGTEISFSQPVQYRFADPIRGEIRRDINVVPALSLSLDHKLLIIPDNSRQQTRRIVMTAMNNSTAAITGFPGLNFNAANEWKYTRDAGSIELKNKGETAKVAFDVTIPANTKPGNYQIAVNVQVGEGLATQEMHTIAYPHIQTHRFYTRAETRVAVLDLKTAPVKVGYIMGSGEEVPDAIRQMGFDLDVLDEKDLAGGDLSRFGTIVVGIRASEARPDFVAHNRRLLDYVKNGGTLIVQYQRPEYVRLNLPPFPAQMGPRVVDENAKVTILDPAHPVFNFPNKIGEEDFQGWVQERNLYNFTKFDPAYKPLLETHDAGEPEDKGGLVIAEMGKGKYVYCSYAFFRQLPAGVPGAYRLFANLLSLGAKK